MNNTIMAIKKRTHFYGAEEFKTK